METLPPIYVGVEPDETEQNKDYAGQMIAYLEDLGYTVNIDQNNNVIVEPPSVEDETENLQIEEIEEPSEPSKTTSNNLIDVLKDKQESEIKSLKIHTTAIKNQNKLIEKQNELQAKIVNSINVQNKALVSLNTVLANNNIINSDTNNVLKNSVNQQVAQSNISIQGNTYSSDLGTISKHLKEMVDKENTTNVTVEAPNVTNEISMDTSSLSQANEKIADSLEYQKQVHENQIEEYNFNKKGNSNLKDTEGNIIIPREVQAKKDAEKAIETKDMNEMVVSDIWEDLQEGLGDGVGSVLEFIGDVGTSFGDGNIGEDSNIDPFSALMKIVEEQEQEQISKLKEELS